MTRQEIKENLSFIVTNKILKDLKAWPIEEWSKNVNQFNQFIYYSPPAKFSGLCGDCSGAEYSIYLDCLNKLRIQPYITLLSSDEEKIKALTMHYLLKESKELKIAKQKSLKEQEIDDAIKFFNIKVD